MFRIDKLFITILIFSAFVTICLANGYRKLSIEMDKLTEYGLDIVNMVDSVDTENKQEIIRLQALANKFSLYAQDVFYDANNAAIHVQRGKSKERLINLVDVTESMTYPIEKNINGDTAMLKKALKATFSNYQTVYPIVKDIEKLLQAEEQSQVARRYSRRAYSISLFNFHIVYGELKFRNQTIEEINKETTKAFNRISETLKKLTGNDKDLLKEFEKDIHLATVFIERVANKMEKWVYIHKKDQEKAKYMSDWISRLRALVNDLLKYNYPKVSTTELRNGLETFLERAATEITKFVEFEKGTTVKLEKEMCREVLLESQITLSALNTQLNILLSLR